MKKNELLSEPQEYSDNMSNIDLAINLERQKFPFCIVWTPLPILTYFLPIIGHVGIATSTGVIRDFAGPYHVAEDNMTFGKPTKYLQLNYTKAKGGVQGWDSAVAHASEIYQNRMHNLCCDNCHSHVATALDLMSYDNSNNWNMVKVALFMLIWGKYVSFSGFLKTWMPFYLLVFVITTLCLVLR
ncbi:transmembrane protein 222 [Bombus vosnesenskii]|uniref:Transmembrane protein 222 n=3 Tax=Pyrobombus TaxID=144703 RepID=A0A6J3KPG3_9HYME|nr:transmembrane protein 222 [Bombus impatiens]XP_033206980.1 transmembrane protein 222 [Bombus vancouverensis nearcticus]XP_033315746.1 transmembrane protein 222 [Bombus bifarius]XP_033355173.1 transmembrane protein 222 [Bombus vosnesenskii]XP_050470582.1 transmembrane protein 222 [Bombus huntii]